MKKNTWIVAGVALALGVFGLGYVARAQDGGNVRFQRTEYRSGGPEPGGAMGFERGGRRISRLLDRLDNERVKATLGLTDDQADRLRKIAVNAEESSIKTGSELAIRGIELRELLRADKPDRAEVMKKAGEISQLRGELMSQRLQALLDAKAVLTPEQQTKIRNFMESRREGGMGRGMMGHPMPRAGRPMAAPTPPSAPSAAPNE